MFSEQSVISVSNLAKSFGRVHALDGVDLEVEPGIFGFIGPNGAGKTTLLRILLGLVRADSGSAHVLGLDVSSASLDIRQKVGVLHERPTYPKSMKALDYLRRVSRLYGEKGSPEEILSIVGLSDAGDRRIGNLSAGMHQRLGIAQALVGGTDLVFLDEPTSSLDVTGRDDVIRLIVSIHNELGVSFFISSHILSELERVCHNVAFIRAGKVVERGTVIKMIKEHTATKFRIVTSDSKRLLEVIGVIPDLADAAISGANTITVNIELDKIAEVQSRIKAASKPLGITIYAFEQASSLEDAYKEIMGDA